MLFESLESRRLLSVSLNPTTHLLTVNGTGGNDTVKLTVIGTNLKVTLNGASSSYALSKVSKITVNAGAGGDTVSLDSTVKIGATINTGSGSANLNFHDSVQGGGGNDTINVQSFFAVANGGNGNDTINVSSGSSTVDGGAGNDRVVVKTAGQDNLLKGGTGVDTIDYSAETHGIVLRNGTVGPYAPGGGNPPIVVGASQDLVSAFENFTAGSGNDYVYGDANANVLKGNAGNDYLDAGSGNDTLYGGTGKDALFGRDGNDTLFSRDGIADFLSGGFGTDKAQKDSIDTVMGVESFLP